MCTTAKKFEEGGDSSSVQTLAPSQTMSTANGETGDVGASGSRPLMSTILNTNGSGTVNVYNFYGGTHSHPFNPDATRGEDLECGSDGCDEYDEEDLDPETEGERAANRGHVEEAKKAGKTYGPDKRPRDDCPGLGQSDDTSRLAMASQRQMTDAIDASCSKILDKMLASVNKRLKTATNALVKKDAAGAGTNPAPAAP